MTRKVDSRMSPWIAPLEERRDLRRRALEAPLETQHTKDDPSPILTSLDVPSSLIESHAGSLAESTGDLTSIVFAGKSLAPHKRRQLDLALKQLYAILGRALDLALEGRRAEVARETIGTVSSLAAELRGSPHLVPALYAVIGLLDVGVRRGGTALPRQAAQVARDLMARLEGRAGIGSLLTVLPVLAEHLDLSRNPDAEARPELWKETAQFLIDAAPLSGASAEIAASLSEFSLMAIFGSRSGEALAPDSARFARSALPLVGAADPLSEALAAFRASFAERREAVRAQLGTTALGTALSTLLDANPCGPETLFASIEQVALLDREDLAPSIARIADSPAAGPLLDAIAAGHVPAFDDERFQILPPGLRSVAIAAAASDPARIDPVVAKAKQLDSDTPFAELNAFADRYGAAAASIAANPALPPQLAGAIARGTRPEMVEHYPALLELLGAIGNALPRADLMLSIGSTAALIDPENRFTNPPAALLPHLLDAVRPLGNQSHDTELAELVLGIAAGLGRVGLDPSRHLQRAVADLVPALSSGLIGSRSAIAVRSTNPVSLLFSSPLPAETRPTAYRFLSQEQLNWVTSWIESNKRETNLRLDLRDFILGCVEANRLDVVEAARISPSPKKAIRSAVREIAQAFRINALPTVMFDPIEVGLRAGRTPIADIQRAKDSEALPVDLVALTEGQLTEEGRQTVMASAGRLEWLLSLCVAGNTVYDEDIDMAAIRPVLLACIKAVASGQWPEWRYETAIGQRLMAKLSADQRALWREVLVTPASPPPPANDPAIARATALVRGIGVALPELIDLGGEGLPPLGWDTASIENLQVVRDDAIEALHRHGKGTYEHREAVAVLSAARENLALLELHHVLRETASLDPAQAILRLRPSLAEAREALASRGGSGFSEAIDEVLTSTEHLRAHPRDGRYAIDEDDFSALLNSHVSGCLGQNHNGKGRQYGLVGGIADANIRMLRVMDGDRMKFRGYLKFFEVDFAGYRGPAIFLDVPYNDNDGDDSDKELWYRHAIAKARLMGMPVMLGKGDGNAALLQRLGQEVGLAVRGETTVNFSLDDGNTGCMHSDTLFDGKGNIRASRGESPTWSFAINSTAVAMPPGRA